LAASLAALHNGKFEEACKYLYKYFESKTDVTFVGEPFPWDLTDVCGELLESGEITPDRLVDNSDRHQNFRFTSS